MVLAIVQARMNSDRLPGKVMKRILDKPMIGLLLTRLMISERIDKIFILSSKEFIKEARQNKTGKNKGKRSIWFNGRNTKANSEHVKPQFEKYLATNFNRILKENPDKL